jgi:single-stranded-DNA-specific exonuclease
MPQYEWIYRPQDHNQKQALENEFSGRSILTETLLSRGILSKQAFLDFTSFDLSQIPSPDLMKDLSKAADRVARAVIDQECIVIHGDYDVDGISATALLVRFFSDLKAQVRYFVPNRFIDGYGVQGGNIEKIKQELGAAIVITVDSGITAFDAAVVAQKNAIDFIITDHHEVGNGIPEAFAVINPRQADCPFPSKDISGVGVAVYLAIGIRQKLRQKNYFSHVPEPNLRNYLDYVALGTIADISPLTTLNRSLVWHGLKLIEEGRRPGILALKEVCGLNHMPVTYSGVAFKIAPRLNAAGRMGTALTSLEVLTATDFSKANEGAIFLDEQNSERKEAETRVLEEAIECLEANGGIENLPAIVLAKDDWHEGVLGIVASRLVEKYYRPTILIAFNGEKGKGSARSIADLNLLACIQKCSKHLLAAGGHKYAAGLSLAKENFLEFKDEFLKIAGDSMQTLSLSPKLMIDAHVQLEDISFSGIKDLQRLAPFGPANPEPTFSLNTQVWQKRIVGENHLKLTVGNSSRKFDAIGFGLSKEGEPLESRASLRIAFQPKVDTFRGEEKISLHIKDLVLDPGKTNRQF